LAFRCFGNVADCVSVYLFDEYESADRFCCYLDGLEPDKGVFFYAKHADQMVEYETAKPLLVSFDRIFERLRSEGSGVFIIREALKKFRSDTLSRALYGLDKNSRMFILQSLPVKTRDEVNENIGIYDNARLSYSREAQQKILDAINRTYDKFRQGKIPKLAVEVLKD
jgi:hypothetical protein